ncbi:MAG: aspartate--tRNA ligase, partial [Planctomycetes bacterium]|nr:aspartate--tRNA ligase [Planctomycetota bacterium]
QIVKCFRDEDKRADRQPEFTQLDVEMAFPEPADVYNLIEGCVKEVMKSVLSFELSLPIPHIPYSEAMQKYGIDRPDVRFGMELSELTEFAKGCGFNAFKAVAESGGVVRALRIPGGHELVSKGQFKNLEKDAKGRGAKGLAFLRYAPEGLDSPIAKFFSEEELQTLQKLCGAESNDLVLILADKAKVVNGILADYRRTYADKAGLVAEGSYEFVWVDEFPLFEYDEETNRLYAAHHPFTAPADKEAFLALAEEMRRTDRVCTPKIVDLAEATKAQAYDLCFNGFELGGGSIRIHEKVVQDAMFDCLGIGPEEADAKFGFLLNALKYGAPPMGGIALGVDRFVMELLGYDNIQDVIAFPKTGGGKGLMDGSPAGVDSTLLDELRIKVVEE